MAMSNGDLAATLDEIRLLPIISRAPHSGQPGFSEFSEALDVVVRALKARDRAEAAFIAADQTARRRLAELEAVIDQASDHKPEVQTATESGE
jgi:hypothetical protein